MSSVGMERSVDIKMTFFLYTLQRQTAGAGTCPAPRDIQQKKSGHLPTPHVSAGEHPGRGWERHRKGLTNGQQIHISANRLMDI